MKLELKHVAPYLPYGLMAIDCENSQVRKVTIIHFTYDTKTVGLNHLLFDGLLLKKHKPLLRNLSDLTKEIEVNGEKFVPIERLFEISYPANKSTKYFYDTQGNYIRCYHDNTTYHKMIYTNIELIGRNTFDDMKKLIEWKFDIFNLIPNGLAIDINSLNK